MSYWVIQKSRKNACRNRVYFSKYVVLSTFIGLKYISSLLSDQCNKNKNKTYILCYNMFLLHFFSHIFWKAWNLQTSDVSYDLAQPVLHNP